MTAEGATLAIDAGQTAMKVRFARRSGGVAERELPGVRTDASLLPQLAEAARIVHRELSEPVSTLVTGVSGLTRRESDAAALLAMVTDLGARRVLLTHDSVTSFLGTLGDARGVVVAAGTGVVTLAVGRQRVARIDGWGNIMGDAGSGYWIGREALEAGMRAFDGRGPRTILMDAMLARWPRLEDAYIELQGDPERVAIVASFAQAVADAAATDTVAAQICLSAARELSHSAVTALKQVSDHDCTDGSPLVSAIGGVFRSTLIRSRFEELLQESCPDVRFEAPHGSGLDGASALADLSDEHPLHELISVAAAAQ